LSATPARVSVSDLVDSSPVGSFQIRMFVLCALCLIIDGFDVQAMGYVAPALVPDLGIPRSAMGTILASANFGVLFGSLFFTALADKIGRRPVLVGSTAFFGVMTLLTARATSAEELMALRFIAGIGMGSLIPNTTALIGEYSPLRLRVTLMMTITVSFTAGAAIGGFVAAWLIPAFGWRSVFYFGGFVPLVIAVLMYFWLPESLQFLVLKRRRLDQVGAWLRRINPAAPTGPVVEYVVHEENKTGAPFKHLLREGRGTGTLLLWLINFMNLLILYFLAGWLPTVITEAGYTTSAAALVTAALQVGGTVGTFGFAWLIARRGFSPVLTVCFAVASISIAAIAIPSVLGAAPLLTLVVFIAGWCIVGGQPGLNALAATYYPTAMRSTGVGWCLGVGRVGGIIGPYLGGLLPGSTMIFAVAAAAVVSTGAMFSLRTRITPQGTPR
jgi:AAHS family 4-hydroxybenzoate transporter-like MFS transporter